MTTIGLAMIVRNGAKTMRQALDPFIGHVDQVSIVLGGPSSDDTEAIAKEYATVISEYQGNWSDDGAAFDFARARQQATDQLTTDWMIVADADDLWRGVEHIRPIIEQHQDISPVIWINYHLSDGYFQQPRIFRRNSGAWYNPLHETWLFNEAYRETGIKVIKAAHVHVTQVANPNKAFREWQNIRIAERILETEPDNLRTIAHLVSDYNALGEHRKAIAMADRYEETLQRTGAPHTDEEFHALVRKFSSQMVLEDYEAVIRTATKALGIRNRAVAWVALGEALYQVSNGSGSTALLELAVFASERAMASGKPRIGIPESVDFHTVSPCKLKAVALAEMGRGHEALHSIDLALAIRPDDAQALDLRDKIAKQIGEVP